MERRDKINYYLDIAQTVSERTTCLRRRFGAIIVKNDSIISTGYVGAPRGRANCNDLGQCRRDLLNVPRGQRYELCRSVHAEQNAIIAASREEMLDSALYLACVNAKTEELEPGTSPCDLCRRFIINAGIRDVYVRETRDTYSHYRVADWVAEDDVLPEELLSTYK